MTNTGFSAGATPPSFGVTNPPPPPQNQPRRYRKRPVEIEAAVFDGTNAQWLSEWTGQHQPGDVPFGTNCDYFDIATEEGVMEAKVGDYVIRGLAGEFYPCKPDIFAATYEAINDA